MFLRQVNEELGEDHAFKHINPRTGRPIRRSAGRRFINPEFVSSQAAIAEAEEDQEPEEGADQSCLEEDPEEMPKTTGKSGRGRKQSKKIQRKKRLRSLSPPLSTHDDETFSRDATPDDTVEEAQSDSSCEKLRSPTVANSFSINLTINIPKDYTGGPITLTLPTEMLDRSRKRQKLHNGASPARGVLAPQSQTSGWHSLSAELRNKVYRLLFVTEARIDFSSLHNLKRSGAFLATCRQVYNEGRTILYMENKFHFERNKSPRNPYWSTKLEEVGWKDVRRFLKHISPQNIALLREVSFTFDDAMPSMSRDMTHEERRYVNDDHLMSCLRMLAKHGKLKKVNLTFYGRREICRADVRFIENLYHMRADVVGIDKGIPDWMHGKMSLGMKQTTIKEMTRRKRLYPMVDVTK